MHILIADDHELIAEGVSSFLKRSNDSYQIRTANDFEALKAEMKTQQFDVLIQDVRFGKIDAREIVEDIKLWNPNCKMIALSSHADEFTVKSVLATGYSAYVTKSAHMDELVCAIETVIADGQYISTDLEKKFFSSLFNKDTGANEIHLTERESEVLKEIQNGLSSKVIADKLCISEKTVETYRSNLFLKFKVQNVASLVKKSLMKGYL